MVMTNYILFDKFRISVGSASGGGIEIPGWYVVERPDNMEWGISISGRYIYNPDTNEMIENSNYEKRTAEGLKYWTDVGWVPEDYDGPTPNDPTYPPDPVYPPDTIEGM